jgi:hypothetical protein
MSKVIVNVENAGSVSAMRRQLAEILSKLKGDQPVQFTFRMTLERYNGKS